MTDTIPTDAPAPFTEEERVRFARGVGDTRLRTVLGFCLDASGSMSGKDHEGGDKREAAIVAFNEFVRAQQEVASDECLMSVMSFSTRSRLMQRVEQLPNVRPLSTANYAPTGNTALFDAIRDSVAELEQIPGDRYVLVILTDGEENASRRTTLAEVREIIREKEATGRWTFTYLSADPDAFSSAQNYGFQVGNVARTANSVGGIREASMRMAHATSAFRGGDSFASSSYYATPGDVVPSPTFTPVPPVSTDDDD